MKSKINNTLSKFKTLTLATALVLANLTISSFADPNITNDLALNYTPVTVSDKGCVAIDIKELSERLLLCQDAKSKVTTIKDITKYDFKACENASVAERLALGCDVTSKIKLTTNDVILTKEDWKNSLPKGIERPRLERIYEFIDACYVVADQLQDDVSTISADALISIGLTRSNYGQTLASKCGDWFDIDPRRCSSKIDATTNLYTLTRSTGHFMVRKYLKGYSKLKSNDYKYSFVGLAENMCQDQTYIDQYTKALALSAPMKAAYEYKLKNECKDKTSSTQN